MLNHRVDCSFIHSFSQSVSQPATQSFSHSFSQPASQPVSQSVTIGHSELEAHMCIQFKLCTQFGDLLIQPCDLRELLL